jgi:hypothetical protein
MNETAKEILTAYKGKTIAEILDVYDGYVTSYKIIFTDGSFIEFHGEGTDEGNHHAYYVTSDGESS